MLACGWPAHWSWLLLGLVAGILFQRTRNLLAPAVMHVAMNALGQTF